MPKRKIREEIKRPDPFQSFVQTATAWIRENRGRCIAAAVAVVVLAAAGWGYAFYSTGKDAKAQYLLSQGMGSFEEYSASPKADVLAKSEESFGRAERLGSAGVRDVARLYLARIDVIKGQKDAARRLYREVDRSASSDVVKKLSETGLGDIDKK